MATATTSAYADGSSLTNFNAWAYWMYQQFIAFGWTQTADTGQGTFPETGSAPSAAGYYAVFKAADSLAGACPIYVKIEFWEASNVPYFGLTVSTGGTDGAGNLLSPVSQRWSGGGTYALQANGASTTNLLPLFASGDAGNIRFVLWPNTNSSSPDYYQGVAIIIARSRDSSGNQTGNYVQVWGLCNTGKAFQTVFAPSVGATNIIDNTGYLIAAYPAISSSSWSNGGAVLVSPVMQNVGGLSNPTPDILIGSNKDFPPGTTATVSIYGVLHTYVSFGANNFYNFLNGVNSAVLVRYE